MPKLIVLGSSAAVPDEEHENTHLALKGEAQTILIDCTGTPIVRLRQAGLETSSLTDLILTHFHPDHVSGTPQLLMDMWLMGRTQPLTIHGLHHTLERVQALLDLYDWKQWPGMYPVSFHPLPESEMAPVLESAEFRIFSSPVRHLLPTIGLRVEFPQSGKALAYSCDTEPCPQVAALAQGVDLLIHEATGAYTGHSTAAQAAGIALQAQARALCLIHYPALLINPQALIAEVSQVFTGSVTLAEDFKEFTF